MCPPDVALRSESYDFAEKEKRGKRLECCGRTVCARCLDVLFLNTRCFIVLTRSRGIRGSQVTVLSHHLVLISV